MAVCVKDYSTPALDIDPGCKLLLDGRCRIILNNTGNSRLIHKLPRSTRSRISTIKFSIKNQIENQTIRAYIEVCGYSRYFIARLFIKVCKEEFNNLPIQ